jgi:cellulose synthase/poly-beta-1,6-N-acetylglucosamine synthase-like glycosyltransferase
MTGILAGVFATLTVVVVTGVNTLLWGGISFARLVVRSVAHAVRPRHRVVAAPRYGSKDVALIMAAHNEEAVLADALRAASLVLLPSQLHVVSDGSSDRTVEIAREFGANVLDLQPNRGKAGALAAGIEYFSLVERFPVMLLHDADTRLTPDYLETGLPGFNDPGVVAVSGVVRGMRDPTARTMSARFLLAYRARVYAVVQLGVKYGQAARWMNVMSICPGFASMYRTDILSKINITRPGLAVEDINMTFELHIKKLGRIAFHPNAAVAYTQDPDNWRDYSSQLYRWTLGFWQTLWVHKKHLGKLWMSVPVMAAEQITAAIALFIMIPVLLFTAYTSVLADTYGTPTVMGYEIFGSMDFRYVLLGVFVVDALFTVFIAISLRRPGLLLLAPLFPFMRFIDSYIILRAIIASLRTSDSNGSWVSPARRELVSSTK